MKRWQISSTTTGNWGAIQVVVTPSGGEPTDVTYLRDVPIASLSWTSTDPFGDATAQMSFDQLTALDDLGVGDLDWLQDWALVDIYLVPDGGGAKTKLWEGMIASYEVSGTGDGSSVSITCIGALYQLDLYVRAPAYEATALPYDDLIRHQFKHEARANLKTKELRIDFPAWWSTTDDNGDNVTGFTTKYSGDWGRPLTGYIQDLLSTMITEGGFQWTLTNEAGRQPVLQLRDRTTVNWTVAAMQPGMEIDATRDLSQTFNVIYGSGTDEAGTEWRNAVITSSRTGYEPLAYDERIHPQADRNPDFLPDLTRIEQYMNFGAGMTQADGTKAAQRILQREREPGWTGTISLKSDPEEGSKFEIKAGDNILVKYFMGSGEDGMMFHIASAEVDYEGGTISLTVDTRGRDLLTLEQALQRYRESKNPARLLRINRESQNFDDVKSPWDYSAGSGFIPPGSTGFDFEDYLYPWEDMVAATPPKQDPSKYVHVRASSSSAQDRWTFLEIPASTRANIASSQFICVDEDGNLKKIPFHVSIYTYEVSYYMMPMDPDTGIRTAFTANAFRVPTADNGVQDIESGPVEALVVGWGDGDQKAGYWPGLESESDPVSGMLRDDGTWFFEQDPTLGPGPTLWVAFYCDQQDEDVYFLGRLYKSTED